MNCRVLVADDSCTMRKILVRSLTAVGLRDTVEVSNGEDALTAFTPGSFGMILTEWNLPRKNGLQLTQEIRRQDRKVKIIMVTAAAEKSRVLEAIAAGVSDYLIKPFTADVLREKLAQHVC